MIYLYLAAFLFLFAFYYSFTRSFISPFSLLLLAFMMSLTIIACNMENWQVEINHRAFIYIFLAVASFGAGCLLSNVLSQKWVFFPGRNAVITRRVDQGPRHEIFLLMVLPTICTLLFVHLSIRIGHEGAGNVFRNIYESSHENSSNFFLHQMREIVVAAAEVSVIAVLAKKYLVQTKIQIWYLIPFLCFVFCVLFSTDRNIFLRFVVFSICTWIFFASAASTRSVQSTNGRILGKTIIILLVAVGLFYLLGKVKSYTSNLERMIGIYGGSGLYNFNLCLDQLETAEHQLGKETFSQFILMLNRFGIDLGVQASDGTEFGMIVIHAPNGYTYASNIYSAMAPYVIDFGLPGVIIFPFILGLFFERLYIAACKKNAFYARGVYALLIYAVVYFPIAEQFFKRFHLGLIYELGWFSILFFAVFGSRRARAPLDETGCFESIQTGEDHLCKAIKS